MKIFKKSWVFATLTLSCVLSTTAHSNPQVFASGLSISMIGQAHILKSGGNHQVVYDIALKNLSKKQIVLHSITTTDSLGNSFTEKGQKLAQNLNKISLAPERVSQLKREAIKFERFIQLSPHSKLSYFGWHRSNAKELNLVVDYSWNNTRLFQSIKIQVAHVPETVMSPPVSGKGWFASNAPENSSRHRRAIYQIGEKWLSPQRFAIDLIRTNQTGERYRGPSDDNKSYFAYGIDVLSISKGKVVEVVDGIEENKPGCTPTNSVDCLGRTAVKMSRKTLAGNTVVLSLGPEIYVTYAHLIPGSIKVKVGDEVSPGDILGKIGNSGNSTEPHLHLHACDKPSSLACDGLPVHFEGFIEIPINPLKGPTGSPVMRKRQMPINSSVINFIG